MFRITDMGDNLEEVVETEDCIVLRLTDTTGDGLMTIYRIFDGGKILQSGTHEQLMQQGSLYRRFVNSRELAVGWKV